MRITILLTILLAFCGCSSSSGGSSSSSGGSNGTQCQLKFNDGLDIFAPSELEEDTTSYHTVRIWNDNSGNPDGDATGKFTIRILVNSTIVQEVEVDNILQGGYKDLYLEVDRSLYPPGNYTVQIILDATNRVSETNEGDNTHTETVSIIAKVIANA